MRSISMGYGRLVIVQSFQNRSRNYRVCTVSSSLLMEGSPKKRHCYRQGDVTAMIQSKTLKVYVSSLPMMLNFVRAFPACSAPGVLARTHQCSIRLFSFQSFIWSTISTTYYSITITWSTTIAYLSDCIVVLIFPSSLSSFCKVVSLALGARELYFISRGVLLFQEPPVTNYGGNEANIVFSYSFLLSPKSGAMCARSKS